MVSRWLMLCPIWSVMHENLRRLGWMCEWLGMSGRARELMPLLDYMAKREGEERHRESSQGELTSHR